MSEYDSHSEDIFFGALKGGCLGLVVGFALGVGFGVLMGWWMSR